MPTRDMVLGIDLGTSQCKGTLLTFDGRTLHTSSRSYPTKRNRMGWVEQNPNDWWRATREIVKECAGVARRRGTLRGIGICGQRESIVPVDEDGRALGSAMLWMDERSMAQVEEMRHLIPEDRLFSKTGLVHSPLFIAPKLMWLKASEPGLYRHAYMFLPAKDYINLRLTDEYSTDFTLASRTMLYDIVQGKWDSGMADLFGLDIEKLPPIRDSGEAVGPVSARVSSSLGLDAGVAVAAGAGDAQCATYGCDALREGDAVDISGTSSIVEVVSERASPPKSSSILFTQHVRKKMKLLEGGVGTSGALVRWLEGVLSRDSPGREGLLRSLESMAGRLDPSQDDPIMLPYFGGSTAKRNIHARGSLIGLTLSAGRGRLLRAVYEGVAFVIRETLEECESLGPVSEPIWSVGGGSQSQFWSRMKADMTGKRYAVLSSHDAGCLGAARLALDALREQVEDFASIRRGSRTFKPDERNEELVSRRYHRFRELYSRLYGA